MTTLLQPNEVVKFSGITPTFPPCDLRMIFSVEYNLFEVCLGSAFYDHLKSQLVDYSATPEYNNSTSYTIGQTVKYQGVYYKCIANTVATLPTNYEFWELGDKFQTECLETLWCSFLAEYLAWNVVESRMPFVHTQIKAEGLVKIHGETFNSASTGDFDRLMAAIKAQIERSFKNLHTFMLNNNGDGCYDLYLSISNGCCSTCGKTSCKCAVDCQTEPGYDYNFG